MNESCKSNEVVTFATLKSNVVNHVRAESQSNYQLMYDKQLEEITQLQEKLSIAESKLMECMKLKNNYSERVVKPRLKRHRLLIK